MPNASFLDTNVLIYAAAGKASEPDKWKIAQDLFADPDAGVSGQVLAEFYHNVVKKKLLRVEAAVFWLERLVLMPCIAVDGSLVEEGVAISRRHRISYWDGAIIAAAQRLGARRLYTEDLNHGQTYGFVQVINPFKIAD